MSTKGSRSQPKRAQSARVKSRGKPKFSGLLAQRLPSYAHYFVHDPALGYLGSIGRAMRESAERNECLKWEKLQALCNHFGLDQRAPAFFRYGRAAIKLAEMAGIPGFLPEQAREQRRLGRKLTWTTELFQDLYDDVQKKQGANKHISETRACRLIAQEKRWKGIVQQINTSNSDTPSVKSLAETLRKRYRQAKRLQADMNVPESKHLSIMCDAAAKGGSDSFQRDLVQQKQAHFQSPITRKQKPQPSDGQK